MALKFLPIPFPISAPPPADPTGFQNHTQLAPTEIRFARWGNSNAERFERRRRTQQEIEDEIRRERRFTSASNISSAAESSAVDPAADTFKSLGTPSSPSRPSIPGRKSKYSKDPDSHPAFRISRIGRKVGRQPTEQQPVSRQASVKVDEDGVSYVIDGAPFEFKYTYTETPKVKPIKMRDPPVSPFGPSTMPRPWTGRAPLPASKKKLKEFDSFEPPPPGKKGVKTVQAPGPFLPGTGPRYVKTREEILGDPLTEEEVKQLIKSCIKSRRQLNIGRDGLTHNMLENIHALWKRRRVCKIKCKGVCTVDMDNVCEQLEERTGGKIIYRKAGVLFLFRGRNYNYRTRPRFPLMLWKPATPVYPSLVKRVPEGLTLQEVTEMRKKGRDLLPICKLAKNGVYCDLVKDVREAFQECELVRINCQGLNKSDYKRIGGKLRDLVPCVLLSFEFEHILIWRGRNWMSGFPKSDECHKEQVKSDADSAMQRAEAKETSVSCAEVISAKDVVGETLETSTLSQIPGEVDSERSEVPLSTDMITIVKEPSECGIISDNAAASDEECDIVSNSSESGSTLEDAVLVNERPVDTSKPHVFESLADAEGFNVPSPAALLVGRENTGNAGNRLDSYAADQVSSDGLQVSTEALQYQNKPASLSAACTEGISLLLRQAIEGGSAVILDSVSLDADIVYERAVAFARSAPPGPVFRRRPKKEVIQISQKKETRDVDEEGAMTISGKRGSQEKGSKIRQTRNLDEHLHTVPQGSLGLDELAKLLA